MKHNEVIYSADRIFISKQDLDPLSLLTGLFCGWVVRDRFGFLNQYSLYRFTEQVDEIPRPLDNGMTFAEIMDGVAKEMLAKHNRIAVSWSGGIDSTALICALLKNKTDKNTLTVFCSDSALGEYPAFYRLLQNKGVSVTVTQGLIEDLGETDVDCITSGWCADQLFGSDIHLKDTSLYNLTLIDGLRGIWKKAHPGIKLSDHSFTILEGIIKDYGRHVGVEVEQFCEFAWLFNFGCKMSYIREKMRMSFVGTPNADKCENFFDHELFQRWSVGNFTNIRHHNGYENPTYFKLPLKQYILEYTNDDDYFKNKGKRNSWNLIGRKLKTVNVVTDNGVKVFRATNLNCDNCYHKLSRSVGDTFRKGVPNQ